MEELVECIVKRKITMKAFIGRCLGVSLGLLFVLLTFIIGIHVPYAIPIALLFDLGVGFIIYFIFRNTNVEFEYDFFDGELTVDKIMNRSKRKRLQVFSFAQFEYMAPTDSPRFGALEERGNAAYYDYSANDLTQPTYTAVFHNDEKSKVFMTFSPNEDLLRILKKIYNRKVYEE